MIQKYPIIIFYLKMHMDYKILIEKLLKFIANVFAIGVFFYVYIIWNIN